MEEDNPKDHYTPNLEELISLSQAADISGFTTRHLRYLAESGQLWAKKLGRNWLTTALAVSEYLAHDRRPGPKPRKDLGQTNN